MKHKIKKVNVFNFLKAESIVKEIKTGSLRIVEHANSLSATDLKEITLNLNIPDSKVWQLEAENKTFLEPNSKKVDSIILLEKENVLHIVLFELKSKSKLGDAYIKEKFEMSICWAYLLLNLLNGKEEQNIKVYGVLVAQTDKQWDGMDDLQIFSSVSIRYKKKSFYATATSMGIDLSDIVSI